MTIMENKRFLITGASGVLGSLIARKLHAQGATLVLAGRDAGKLAALGIPAEMFTQDLSIVGAARALVQTVVASGPLDGVIAAHGVVSFGPVSELTETNLQIVNNTNFISVAELFSSSYPALAASAQMGNAPIAVSISGVIAESPMANLAAYSAAKSALNSFMTALQREWRRDGISVLDCRPPHTETGFADRAIAGTVPTFPQGLAPEVVAERIVEAITANEKDLPSTAFG